MKGNIMGASWQMMEVFESDKAKVAEIFEAAQQLDRYENGHCYSGGFGMATGLLFESCIFRDVPEAEAFLESKAKKWHEAIAVRVTTDKGYKWIIGANCAC